MEPWGEVYDDANAGLIARAIYEVNRDRKKHRKPLKLTDCMIQRTRKKPGETGKPQTPDELRKSMELWASVTIAAQNQREQRRGGTR